MSPSCRLHKLSLLLLVCAALLGFRPSSAQAHPLGNISVNHMTKLELRPDQLQLTHVTDMAEIPSFTLFGQLDSNHDAQIDAAERKTYLQSHTATILPQVALRVDDAPVQWQLTGSDFTQSEGQNGLPVFRIVVTATVALAPNAAGVWDVKVNDETWPGRTGWREVVIVPAPGIKIQEADVPVDSPSQELHVYPTDGTMLDVTSGHARFERSTETQPIVLPNTPPVERSRQQGDWLSTLLRPDSWTPITFLIALLAAFGLGAFHAMAPGHGKTLVAAYLVGSRGTIKHALILGLATTVTHTAGVFALGLILLLAADKFVPDSVYPWLGVASGALIVGLGAMLLRQRWATLRNGGASSSHDHAHEEGLTHDHGNGNMHSHPVPHQISMRNLIALGISGGLIPCPSALVLLLSAVAVHQIALGLVLIVAFSAGLAGILTVLGIILVKMQALFSRVPASGRLLRVLPVAGALVVTGIGSIIVLQSLMEAGLWR